MAAIARTDGLNIAHDFIITQQGRQFVLYPGLLDAAHRAGLRRISTELVQLPTPANDDTCIVHCTVELTPPDGRLLLFDGIGDASPRTVGKSVAPHYIRMAETRAKARALRDALNVTAELADELCSTSP